MAPERLKAIIEAALLAQNQPMSVAQLAELFVEEDQVDRQQIAQALTALSADCEGRGIELREVASGFRYQVRQDTHRWISRLWTERPSRYSRALLETLALIAYRQPITRPEIEQIRGVVVSSNIIKTLEEREWIRVIGYRDVPGRPALFGTTRMFLDYFNLKSLDELPPLAEIREMSDPQMSLPEPIPAYVSRELPLDPEADGTDGETTAPATDETGAQADPAHHPADPTPHEAASGAPAQAPSSKADPLANLIADNDPPSTSDSLEDAEATRAERVTPATADEAENPADADDGDATQDTKEHRA